MTINYVGLNYKAYYSAHFHQHANLYVILIYLVFHLHPSRVCNKMTSSTPGWLVSSIQGFC